MKTETETTKTLTLKLTEHEASWLRDYLQNACGDPHDEHMHDRDMRQAFFESLKRGLE